jgi:hypothetical protein
VTENDAPTSRGKIERLREVALWIRDSSLGTLGFVIVATVAFAGWTVSFIGLHTFAMQHMQLSWATAWLVPVTYDGAPAGLTLVVMRAASHGRSALVWRLLIVVFTMLSCLINYVHLSDHWGRIVAALMPLAAVVVFEALISEARKAAERRAGIAVRPRLHPLRFVFDWTGSWDIVRRHVMEMPLPERLAASQRRAASRPTGSARGAAASASPAAPGSPTATPPLAAPPASPGVPVPAPASPPAARPSQGAASPEPGSPGATVADHAETPAPGGEARDLDEVAAAFRALEKTLGKSPSDQALADHLGVSRSRAQQLRTAAIKAGHADLAKPLRAAS